MLVGADAAALELRCLAGYMAMYDNGDYVRTVLEGKSEDKTDIHNVNARALGCTRPQAKVWFYAFIYGAGDGKLGSILEAPPGQEIAWGKRSRARFLKNLPALGKITKRVKERVEGKAKLKDGRPAPRYLNGVDGRRLHCRSSHSAFNTLLQSAGAVFMKKALVILDDQLQRLGLIPGDDYEFVGNIHDEWQMEVSDHLGEVVGQAAKESIRLAGEAFKFGCPLDGDFKIGRSWQTLTEVLTFIWQHPQSTKGDHARAFASEYGKLASMRLITTRIDNNRYGSRWLITAGACGPSRGDPMNAYRVYVAAWSCFFGFWSEALPLLLLPEDE